MSSHHIVRDEQEPALVLWQAQQITFAQAGELLEWSPRLVVHQQALAEALQWGSKLDAVFSPQSLVPEVAAQVAYQQPVEVLPLPEQHELAAVVAWLKEKKQASLNLVANAEAEDYSLLRQLEPLQQLLQLQVFSQGWRYSYFAKGEAQKWLPEQQQLRIVAFGAAPAIEMQRVLAARRSDIVQEYRTERAGILYLSGNAPFWLGERI